MSAPSRAEVFGEVIQLRETLDAIQRAWDDGDDESLGAILDGDDLDEDDGDEDMDSDPETDD